MNYATSGSADDVTTCDALLSLVVDIIDQLEAVRPHRDMTAAESCHVMINRVVNKVVTPFICLFGIVGNLLNLVVLTRKRLQRCMDCIEKSSNMGFVGLAVADMIFCLAYFSTLVVPLSLTRATLQYFCSELSFSCCSSQGSKLCVLHVYHMLLKQETKLSLV